MTAAPTGIGALSMWALLRRLALAELAALAVAIVLSFVFTGANLARGPDSAPEKARAAAAWAGLRDTSELKRRDFLAGDLHDTGWHLIWGATPEHADEAMVAAAFTAPFAPCRSERVPGHSPVVFRCQTARDSWRRPDGNVIERRVVRGRTRQGTDILYLHVADPD